MTAVSAIPKHLLTKAKEKKHIEMHLSSRKCLLTLSEYRHRLAQNESRGYHWLLINKGNVDIKACSKWARDLQTVDL